MAIFDSYFQYEDSNHRITCVLRRRILSATQNELVQMLRKDYIKSFDIGTIPCPINVHIVNEADETIMVVENYVVLK